MTHSAGTPRRLYVSKIPSGNAYKVQLLAHQLGLTIDLCPLDILADPPDTRQPEFLKKNPNGRVPVLELGDGRLLAESNAILYFLAKGSQFWPSDHWNQSLVLQWMFFEQYSHEPYIAVLKFWTYWGGLHRCSTDQIDLWTRRGNAALDVMNRVLGSQEYFGGKQYSIADIALFAYTQSVEEIGFSLIERLNIKRWFERVRNQPRFISIEPAVPHCESSSK